MLVGPDNGLLWPASRAPRRGGRGGRRLAVAVPAGADLGDVPRPRRVRAGCRPPGARGAASRTPAKRSTPASLTPLERERAVDRRGPRRRPRVSIDRFGNAVLDLADRTSPQTGLRLGRHAHGGGGRSVHDAVFTLTFADVDAGRADPLRGLLPDLALAVNRGSAAERAGPRAAATRSSCDRCRARRDGLRAPAPPLRAAPTRPTSAPASWRSAGRRSGTRRHRRRADRGARAPGAGVERAGRQGAAVLGDPAPAGARARASCRWPSRSPSARRSSRWRRCECRVKWPNDVWIDERKARRGPDRGPSRPTGR